MSLVPVGGPPRPYEATTQRWRVAYPFLGQTQLAPGVIVGRSSGGSVFAYDPFSFYRHRRVTNPNVVIFGESGMGKSSCVKVLLGRMCLLFGAEAVILDPTDEYGGWADALGFQPLRMGGASGKGASGAGVNMLEAAAGDPAVEAVMVRRVVEILLSGTASPRLAAEQLPLLRAAVDHARRRDDVCTLKGVAHSLRAAPMEVGQAAGVGDDRVADLVAPLRGVLGETIESGPLGAMIGERGSARLRDQPINVVVMPSGLGATDSAAGMYGLLEWIHHEMDRRRHAAALVGRALEQHFVVDEAWQLGQYEIAAREIQIRQKTARRSGIAVWLIFHRPADLGSGAATETSRRIMSEVISDAQTRIAFGQTPDEAAAAARLLGLPTEQAGDLAKLGLGEAVWYVGRRLRRVRHTRSPYEVELTDTDHAMGGRTHPHTSTP